jgi:hypothetical protein
MAQKKSKNIPKELKGAIQFHGHFCPGLTIGYRAAKIALRELGGKRAKDEEMVCIIHTDGCGVDGIQFLREGFPCFWPRQAQKRRESHKDERQRRLKGRSGTQASSPPRTNSVQPDPTQEFPYP